MTRNADQATCPQLLMQCPCCDYFTLDQRDRYEICPVCYWEDEPLLDEREASSANLGMALADARINFLAIGACYPSMKKHVLAESKRSMFQHIQRPVVVPKERFSS
ncbi:MULTISPECIES: CPCC family cysteine-rich protein [Corallincola]|nr:MULTISPECIES: CPCC family cysteine-rich protein [Corallincola]